MTTCRAIFGIGLENDPATDLETTDQAPIRGKGTKYADLRVSPSSGASGTGNGPIRRRKGRSYGRKVEMTVYGVIGESLSNLEETLETQNGGATVGELLRVVGHVVALCKALDQTELNRQAADYLASRAKFAPQLADGR